MKNKLLFALKDPIPYYSWDVYDCEEKYRYMWQCTLPQLVYKKYPCSLDINIHISVIQPRRMVNG